VTTVGYGDVSPTTPAGKCFCCFVIVCGIIFLAMPLTIVGNNFSDVWNDRELLKLQTLVRQMLIENGWGPDEMMVAFKEFDRDGDGNIDTHEFFYLAKHILKLPLTKVALHKLWRSIDVDGSGSIQFAEFAAVCFGMNVEDEEMNSDPALRNSQAAPTEENDEVPDSPSQPLPPAGGGDPQLLILKLLQEQAEATKKLTERFDRLESSLTDVKTAMVPPSSKRTRRVDSFLRETTIAESKEYKQQHTKEAPNASRSTNGNFFSRCAA